MLKSADCPIFNDHARHHFIEPYNHPFLIYFYGILTRPADFHPAKTLGAEPEAGMKLV